MTPRASSQEVRRRRPGDLPAWYYRVSAIEFEGRDITPYDFDQDISDLEETSETSKDGHGTACASCERYEEGDDWNCECELSSSDQEDSSSQRSYDGSDAD